MKIVKLKAENIKRLTAIEITPEGNVVTIGGKNGAGKSSVLDSIAYALGGKELVPTEPIRKGELRAEISVDLGDIVVTRKFSRKKPEHQASSTLVVKSKEGTTYSAPQTMLDELLGDLSFDPMDFCMHSKKEQRELLAEMVGYDSEEIDSAIAEATIQRREFKKRHDIVKGKLSGCVRHDVTPNELIPVDSVSDSMLEAERIRQQKNDAERHVLELGNEKTNCENSMRYWAEEIEKAEALLKKSTDMHLQAARQLEKCDKEIVEASRLANEIVVPDVDELRQKITNIEEHNKKIASNKGYDELERQRLEWETETAKATLKIDKLREDKAIKLENINYPIEGLSLEEDGVYWYGLPFEQASTSERMRVSVAIGLALNPDLKILLVRDGSNLDTHSLKAIQEQAKDADAQLWIERVAESKDGVQVFIEEGELK